jgi:hypothetical protein
MNKVRIIKKTFVTHSKDKFFLLILAVALIQGLWYALTFQPSILDEAVHVGFMRLYADEINPFINQQNTNWDWLGDITRNASFFYYYILSFPLRVVQVFSDSYMLQVVFLRLLHIGFFLGGIFAYKKFFNKLGISENLSNVVLLFLILTPALSILPGVVNYDSVVFLFSGLLLYQAAIFVENNKITLNNFLYINFIIIFGTLIKYSFLALVLPVAIYLFYDVIKNKKYVLASKPLKKKVKLKQAVLMFAVFFGMILVVERPVSNMIVYGNPSPSCINLYGTERCSQNHTARRNIAALESRPINFEPKSLYQYTVSDWLPNMVRTQVRLNPWDVPSNVMLALYYVGFFGGIVLVLIYLRSLMRLWCFSLILISITIFTVVLLLQNYKSYVNLGEVVATSSRYLLPVQPLFMLAVLASLYWLLREYKNLQKILFFAIVSCFIFFGGGISTYYNTADPELRWSNLDNEK